MLNRNARTTFCAGLIASSLLVIGVSTQSYGAPAHGIAGTWSGAGTVHLSTGESEKVRCRATISKRSERVYTMFAVCATASVRVTQNAVLDEAAPNRYVGSFTNDEFGISGTIRVTLKGSTLTAALNASGASAVMTMSR
jgi:hypothetical protein